MTTLLWIIGSTLLISIGALVGILTLSVQPKRLHSVLLAFVGFSSGALLGGAFLHLLPEGLEMLSPSALFGIVLGSIVLYLIVEKVLHWHHCHQEECPVHTLGYMNLFGDAVHNFIDGLIIAAAFAVDTGLGITTTLAIALHEIPQEIGDFGVLLYSGFSKARALVLNFSVALMVVAGGIVGWMLSSAIEGITAYLIPIAAGGFIYIAVNDLIPELRKENNMPKFFFNLFFMIAGIGLMVGVKLLGE